MLVCILYLILTMSNPIFIDAFMLRWSCHMTKTMQYAASVKICREDVKTNIGISELLVFTGQADVYLVHLV